MFPFGFDLAIEFEQPPFEHRRAVAFPAVEDYGNVLEMETRLAVGADLLEPQQVPVVVASVVGLSPARRVQQSDGFVVENGSTAQSAAAGQVRNGEHLLQDEPYSTRQVKLR